MWQIESIRLREITLPPKVFPQIESKLLQHYLFW